MMCWVWFQTYHHQTYPVGGIPGCEKKKYIHGGLNVSVPSALVVFRVTFPDGHLWMTSLRLVF